MFHVTTRKHLGRMCLVLSFWAVVSTGVSSLDNTGRLYKRARQQMRELENTLREIETMPHSFKKRSTDISEKCDDLIRSVHKMCHDENPRPAKTTDDLSTKPKLNIKPTKNDITEEENENDNLFEDLEFYRNGTFPDILLYKTTAKRYGEDLEVEFELIHSSKIYVMLTHSLDYPKKFMESTKELEKTFDNVPLKLSRASLTFNASRCQDRYDTALRDVHVLITGDDVPTYLDVGMNICEYDQMLNANADLQGRKENGQVVRSQNFEIPKLQILSDPGDTIIIERGQNPSIEIEMRLTPNIEFWFSYYFYDWQENKFVSHKTFASLSSDTRIEFRNQILPAQHNSQENNLLLVDVLEVTVQNYEESSDSINIGIGAPEKDIKYQIKYVDSKIRLRVDIGSRELSGRLHIGYAWGGTDVEIFDIVEDFMSTRLIMLKLPYKIHGLPQNFVVIQALNTQCDKDGNRNGIKYGKDCTIKCLAQGTNIKSILIIKSPYRFPVKSSSHVFKNTNGYVIQNVGPISHDVQGNYRCTVVFENGKTKNKDLFLATSGFTTVTDFTMEDFGNSTLRLVCKVSGYPPLNVSISSYGDGFGEDRVDNKVGALRSIETIDNLTTRLTIIISTDEFQYPKNDYATCSASGSRGSHTLGITPSDFLNVYNPYIPKLIKENSTVVTEARSDTTTTIFCLATSGGKPVDVMVTTGNRGSRFRIDYNPENVRSQQETDEGSTLLTLTVPTRFIERQMSWLYCGAENEFGEDWIEFYPPRYLAS